MTFWRPIVPTLSYDSNCYILIMSVSTAWSIELSHMSRLSRFSKNPLRKLMRYKPESVLNTSRVRKIKTSLNQLLLKVKVNLPKRNVPAVTRKNTSVKIALTRRIFAASAKSRAISKLLAERNKSKRMTMQT